MNKIAIIKRIFTKQLFSKRRILRRRHIRSNNQSHLGYDSSIIGSIYTSSIILEYSLKMGCKYVSVEFTLLSLLHRFFTGNDILWQTTELFKMRLSVKDLSYLASISQPMEEFILLCNFAGEPCSK